jgi:hypothetical protein
VRVAATGRTVRRRSTASALSSADALGLGQLSARRGARPAPRRAWSDERSSRSSTTSRVRCRGPLTSSRRSPGGLPVAEGSTTSPTDPTIAFGGWAAWDGTSFATPIAAAVLARTMSRNGLASAAEAQAQLLATSPPAPQPDFPHAVLLDELEGIPEPS